MALLRSAMSSFDARGGRGSRSTRGLAGVVSLALTAALSAFAFAAAPADAVVTLVGTTNAGVQPRSATLPAFLFMNPPGTVEFANPVGNPVVSSNNVYAIYWDPTDHYHGDWQHLVDGFLRNMGAASGSLTSVFAVTGQYTDAANHHAQYATTFQGAYTDTDAYPGSECKDPNPPALRDRIGPIVAGNHTEVCLTDKQIHAELEQFLAQHSLPKGMGTIYYLLTPPAVTVCLDAGGPTGHCSDYEGLPGEESYEDSFCSYHSDISPTSPIGGDANTILYGVIPWSAGGLEDGHLAASDQLRPVYDCQDGGFDPSSKPTEEREKTKVKTTKEIEEFEKETPEEQEKQRAKEALEGPHEQQPNQQECPSADGYCDAGLADLIVNQIANEQQDIVTDPLLDAWHDTNNNDEAADECRNFFAPVMGGGVEAKEGSGAGTLFNQALSGGHYYLNSAFNLAAQELPYPGVPCVPGVRLEPQFTAPAAANANELVGFDGMESDITLGAGVSYSSGLPQPAYATYTWNFGDGSAPVSGHAPGAPSANSPASGPCAAPWEAPCAASAFHSFQYGGVYEVTLTVTDVAGNTARLTQPIAIIGPPAPSTTPSPSGGATPAGSSSPTSSPGGGSASVSPSTTTAASVPALPAPVVTGSTTSTSLKKAIAGGLAVHYVTNEQVAGSVQVLLDAVTAKRLGIHGSVATGLPQGTPRSIVVGTAVLVTTKAGEGTVKIKFSARAAARLKRIHKVKLMLRLFARNAARQNPQTTTVLSTVTLNR